MGYEGLDADRPPSGGGLAAHRPPAGRLDLLELESLPLTQQAPSGRAGGSGHPRRRTTLVTAGLVAGLGLGVAWNAHLSDARQEVVEPARVNATDSSRLTSQLTGPTSAPILLLHNDSPHTVRVVVNPSSGIRQAANGDVPGSQQIDATGPVSTLTSDPELPVVLFAGQTIAVLLRVHMHGCLPVASSDWHHYLLLTGAPIAVAHTVPRTGSESTLVDLSTLLDAEHSRACRRAGS